MRETMYRVTWLDGVKELKPLIYETIYTVRRGRGWWKPWVLEGSHGPTENGYCRIIGEIGNFHTKSGAARRKKYLESHGVDLLTVYRMAKVL